MAACFFDLAFWKAAGANVLGVFIAGALAFWTDRRVRAGRRKAQLRDVLKGLHEAIEHNQELLIQLRAEIWTTDGSYPTFNVDPWSLQVLIPRLLETGGDMALVSRVNDYRYQLEHLARKVDVQFRIESQLAPGARNAAIDPIRHSIYEHIPALQNKGSDILASL